MHIIWIVLVLCVIGWRSDFIPSESWRKYGLYTAILLSGIATIWIYLGYASGKIKFHPRAGRIMGVVLIPIIPAFVVFVIWGGVVHGVSSVITKYMGSDHTEELSVKKVYKSRRYNCDFRFEGEAFESAFPNHLCIPQEMYYQLPEVALIKFSGPSTSLGFIIEDFTVVNSKKNRHVEKEK